MPRPTTHSARKLSDSSRIASSFVCHDGRRFSSLSLNPSVSRSVIHTRSDFPASLYRENRDEMEYIEHVMANRIKSVADPEAYFTALVGPHAPDTNNILLAEVDDSSVAGTLISDYVGYLLSMKINVHVLQEFFFNTPGLKENRSVEGWFFEAKFFSLVSRSQNQSITLFTSGKFCSDLSLFSF